MELKNTETKELLVFVSIAILVVGIFSFVVFGLTGLRVFFGIVFISVPFYFILNNFELSESEKFVFSILLGLTLFSSLVYLLGLLVSFRMAIAVAFALFILADLLLRKYRKPKNASN